MSCHGILKDPNLLFSRLRALESVCDSLKVGLHCCELGLELLLLVCQLLKLRSLGGALLVMERHAAHDNEGDKDES